MMTDMVKPAASILQWLLIGYGGYRAVVDLWQLTREWKRETRGHFARDEAGEMLARRKPPHLWNTALFFPDYTPDMAGSPTSKLLDLISAARVSIQICVYLTSYLPIENAILKKHAEGLIIQVVTCYDSLMGHNNHFKNWASRKIPIRTKCTRYLMHNKFVIIDDEAVITGSLNWTNQGVTCNQENVIVSTDPRHVGPYREKFAELWHAYADE